MRSLLAVLVAAPVVWPGAAAALFQGDPDDQGRPWPTTGYNTTDIPMCVKASGEQTEDVNGKTYTIYPDVIEWSAKRALLMNTLRGAWEKWTGIVFVDEGECGSDVAEKIRVELVPNDCGGCGDVTPRGYHPGGVRVWLMMGGNDEHRLRQVIIHEFGHALGFRHEMDRLDAYPDPDQADACTRVPHPEGQPLTPYYDPVSIMDYCAPYNGTGLSLGDIDGAQTLYGTSREWGWLKALPGLSLYGM